MNRAVFCTSLIDDNRQRYIDWVDYYSKFFEGTGTDLFMINDGPADYLPVGVTVKTFGAKLGRKTVWVFPGWKRSFFHALLWLSPIYDRIAHVESDCWITERGRDAFMDYFGRDGYYTGYTPSYNFPETALQILNSRPAIQYILDKYSCEENWHEDIDFEQDIKRLRPEYILEGDRVENKYERFDKRFTFVSGVTYREFEKLYGD